MDADTLFLSDISDDLITIYRVAAFRYVRSDRIQAVYHYRIVAVGTPCGISSRGACRLCVSRRKRIRSGRRGLVRICIKSVDLGYIVIQNLLGALRRLGPGALGVTGLVSFAELDRKLLRAVCDVAVSSYTISQCPSLFFADIPDVVVTKSGENLCNADASVSHCGEHVV